MYYIYIYYHIYMYVCMEVSVSSWGYPQMIQVNHQTVLKPIPALPMTAPKGKIWYAKLSCRPGSRKNIKMTWPTTIKLTIEDKWLLPHIYGKITDWEYIYICIHIYIYYVYMRMWIYHITNSQLVQDLPKKMPNSAGRHCAWRFHQLKVRHVRHATLWTWCLRASGLWLIPSPSHVK